MASITKRNGKWRCIVRGKGHPTVSKTFNIKALAKKWALSVEAARDAPFVDEMPGHGVSFKECLVRYTLEISPLKKGHSREVLRLGHLSKEPWAALPISEIKARHLAAWRDSKLKAGLSPSSVVKALAAVSHVFTIAIKEWGYEVTNPVTNIRKPRINNARDRRLNPGELELLLSHCNAELRAWVVIAIETAMRRGEMAGLTTDMIKGNLIHLSDTKNGSARIVPLSTIAIKALGSLSQNDSGKVWRYEADYYTRQFIKAYRNAGIVGLRLHDLRREGCSRLFEKKLSIFEVKAISGHKSTKMLERYVTVYTHDLLAKLG